MSDENVPEPGRETAPDEHADAPGASGGIESADRFERVDIVDRRRVRDVRVDRPAREGRLRLGGDGTHHDVHARQVCTRSELERLRSVVQGSSDIPCASRVRVGDEHACDTRRVEELARPRAHRPRRDRPRARCSPHPVPSRWPHRKSGPCSSRHPPEAAGTLPFPRRRTTTLTAMAIPATRRPRWNAFMDQAVYRWAVFDPLGPAGRHFPCARMRPGAPAGSALHRARPRTR